VDTGISPIPDVIEALKALLVEATQRADEAEARLANAKARESATEAMIAHLKLQIAKLRRKQYGASAERTVRLLAQMELQLEDLEADGTEDELAAEAAAMKTASAPPSSASGRRGSRFPITCRASASSSRHRVRARSAAALGSPGSARTSPRRSR
jgi:hypothetical protein